MSTSVGPVLVTGARGSVGRHVLADLRAAGVAVRATARRPEPGLFPPGVETVAVDLTRGDQLRQAFAGMRQVFLYAVPGSADGVLEAARATGVRRIVLMSSGSVVHPTSRGNAVAEEHREVEAAFLAAGDVAVVPVRPMVLATNAAHWAPPIRRAGTVPLYRPEASTAPIHERDVAAVAVRALAGPADPALSGILTGPERLTQRAQVAVLAAAAGRPVEVEELSRDEAAARYARFMPEGEAESVLRFLDDAAAGNSPVTDVVESVLGRPALAFTRWAADHADDVGPARRDPATGRG